jgi:hypothetical protein
MVGNPPHQEKEKQMDTTPVAITTPVTYANRSDFELLINEAGLTFREQSGFLRVDGPKGNRIYVAATKTVRRVDLSGFEAPLEIAKPHKLGTFGGVSQELRITGDLVEDLARFATLLEILKAQAPKEPVAKAKAEKAAAKVETPEERAARMVLIKETAARLKVKVSSKIA